jgi:hypothetical protein
MKRRLVLLSIVVLVMAAVVAMALQPRPNLLVLEWAYKAPKESPPVAVLLEFGINETKEINYSGTATVTGAKVVHREGYRFRATDKLVEPSGWTASSHRGLRVSAKDVVAAKLEAHATVGVVLHLADVKDDATLTIEPKDAAHAKQSVPLKAVLAGHAHQLWKGSGVVRLVSTATPVEVSKAEDDFPAACYGPDGTLWVAYVSYHVHDDSSRIEPKGLLKQPDDFKEYYTPEFADQLFVKAYRGGKWSERIAVTGPKESIARCAIAAEAGGDVWVAYSVLRQGRHLIHARSLRAAGPPDQGKAAAPQLGPELLVSDFGATQLSPVMCTAQTGDVYLAFQTMSVDPGKQFFFTDTAKLSGGKAQRSSGFGTERANQWGQALAAPPGGDYALALGVDDYQGNYGVHLELFNAGQASKHHPIAASSRFAARPSLAYDAKGRLWIAYEEGPELWGKDYGTLGKKEGNPLYTERSVRVVCLDTDGKLKRPAAELPTSVAKPPDMGDDGENKHGFKRSNRYGYPKIGIDGKGRVWLTYRQNFGTRYSTHPGSYWLTFARRLDGDTWSEPIEIHHSDGLLDSRPVLLPHNSGGLLIVHNTDGRMTTPEVIDNQIYMSVLNLPGEPVEPKLVPHDAGVPNPKAVARAKEEAEAVARMRKYRVEVGGKKYQFLRGDFHRHTEISFDGGADGSLEDMFRYAIDAAALDWIGNGDHDNGSGREYAWWLTQKFIDGYHAAGRFTPMFGYERSCPYPHGHRNVMFDKRGVRTLLRLKSAKGAEAEKGGLHADDTKMLYRYLHEMGGICAPHTSATNMGTDWSDHDDKVEPIVEIYQGDRMSYEMEGAPRAGFKAGSGKQPINIAGWFPKGYVNHALDKGYRLGFQASSDHLSTHIAFFVVLAERHDRAAILDATRKRHCYGATDNIVLDVRSGEHIMGDEFTTNVAPTLELVAVGTNKIAKIDIIRDGQVVETIKPQGPEYRGKWTDPQPLAGTHYYYVRVLQADEEIAWGSPLWINYTKAG